ncbi:hypothetical protein ACFY7C_17955 [Streptomyces sp. NPDC012769]|uniref:hypothetical protein n=1 Tax=Streptomyces sp. NPDC012769 TaxID=3364848 RepID=UPI0036B89E81
MPSRDDRTALDLLDAHLEALWDRVDPPPPPAPDGLGADGAGELVRRTLDRLRRLPRDPEEVFRREVGGLLVEFRGERCPWNAAALRLLDDPYVFVATGPRRHEDWARDVLAVLHRTVEDPRGWLRLDGDRGNAVRDALPAYPFDPPPAARFPEVLHPLERRAAVAALAVMSEEWQGEPAPVRSRPNRDAALADARTLLDRYGPTARYWTNATAAASDPAPDFVAAGLRGTDSYRFVTSAYVNGLDIFDDLGLVAVSEEEIGVFWSIGAY